MAESTITASTPVEADAAQLWAKELNREAVYGAFWSKFMGKGPNNIIEIREDFKKNKGDAINFGLISDLSQVVHGDGWLEGNEEAMSTYWDSVLLDQIGNAVRPAGALTEQRASWDMRFNAKESLKIWAAVTFDKIIFYKLSGTTFTAYPGTSSGTLGSLETALGAATANTNVIYGGDAVSTATVEESDVFTLDMIVDAKTCAETGVLGTSTIYRMRPILYNGALHYICVIHPYQKADLKKSADYKSLMKEAEVRGKENPLFSGADFFYDGVWIYVNRQITTASTWGEGSNVAGATALFMGAQAGLLAVGQKDWSWVEKTFDFGNKWGVATRKIMGFDKATFNSVDFSVIAMKTAAKNPKL